MIWVPLSIVSCVCARTCVHVCMCSHTCSHTWGDVSCVTEILSLTPGNLTSLESGISSPVVKSSQAMAIGKKPRLRTTTLQSAWFIFTAQVSDLLSGAWQASAAFFKDLCCGFLFPLCRPSRVNYSFCDNSPRPL